MIKLYFLSNSLCSYSLKQYLLYKFYRLSIMSHSDIHSVLHREMHLHIVI
nr:MAG TPA: hypothetical protein [Bacteriophage sp.]